MTTTTETSNETLIDMSEAYFDALYEAGMWANGSVHYNPYLKSFGFSSSGVVPVGCTLLHSKVNHHDFISCDFEDASDFVLACIEERGQETVAMIEKLIAG